MSRAGRKPSPCHRERKRKIAFARLCRQQPITCRPYGGTLFIGGPWHLRRQEIGRHDCINVPIPEPVSVAWSDRDRPVDSFIRTEMYCRKTWANGHRRVDVMVHQVTTEHQSELFRELGLRLMGAVEKLARNTQVWRRLPGAFLLMQPTPSVSEHVREAYRGPIWGLCTLDDWIMSAVSGPGWTIQVPHLGIDVVLP